MKKLNVLIVALSVTLLLPMASQSEEKSAPPAEQSTPAEKSAEAPAKCLKAAVNPVTGHAICLEPRGAPVDPPERTSIQRPCKPRAHDSGDPFTVYEHWSGCHE